MPHIGRAARALAVATRTPFVVLQAACDRWVTEPLVARVVGRRTTDGMTDGPVPSARE